MSARAPRLLLVAAFAPLVLAAVTFASKAAAYLSSPYSRDYGEGCVLALTQLLARHGTYFLPIDRYPMVHGIYPPVFILLNLAGQAALGPSLIFPRALSLLSTLGVTFVLFALLRRRTADAWLAGALALLFLAPWFVQTWAPLARVDMLATLLSVVGLFLFAKHGRDPGIKGRTPYFCFVLAAFTKQSALLAPAAVLLAVLIDPEERRHFPRNLAAFLVPLGLLVAGLVLITQGEAYRHLGPYTAAADYSWSHMLRNATGFLVLGGPLLAVIGLGLAAAGRDLLRGFDLAAVIYWVLGMLSLATFAKAGAAQNYFIEPWVATLLLTGIVLGRLEAKSPDMFRHWPALVLVAAGVALLHEAELGRLPQPIRNPTRSFDFMSLDEAVRNTSGPILSENLSVLAVNGKEVQVEPFGMLLLSRQGLWNPDRLAADCRAGRFELIVSEHRLLEIPGISGCLDERYELWRQLGPYDLFRPRP